MHALIQRETRERADYKIPQVIRHCLVQTPMPDGYDRRLVSVDIMRSIDSTADETAY